MQRYNYGNLAVREQYEQRKGQPAYRETRKVVRKAVSISGKEKLLYLIVIMMCVVIAGSVIWKHAEIYAVNTKMMQLEKEISRIDKENQELKLEVSKLDHPQRLQELGRQLGFSPIAEDHVNQINPAENGSVAKQRESSEVAVR